MSSDFYMTYNFLLQSGTFNFKYNLRDSEVLGPPGEGGAPAAAEPAPAAAAEATPAAAAPAAPKPAPKPAAKAGNGLEDLGTCIYIYCK